MTVGGFRHPSAALMGAVALAVIAGVLFLVGLKSVALVVVAVAAACFVADIVMSVRRK